MTRTRILLVEDEVALSDPLAFLLEREGYEVERVATFIVEARDITLGNFTYPSGAGMSHETILFDASWREDGRTVTKGLVARVKPVANMVFPDDLFDSQYRVMRLMHEKRYVPVAEPHPLFETKLGAVDYAAGHEMVHNGQIGLLRRLMGKPALR